jgi:hypothetical protein
MSLRPSPSKKSPPSATTRAASLFVALLALLGSVGELRGRIEDPAERDYLLATPISRTTLGIAHGLHDNLLQGLYTFGLAIAPALLGMWVHDNVWAAPLFAFFAIWTAFGITALFELPVVVLDRLRGPDAASAFSALLRGLLLAGAFLGTVLGMRAMHSGIESLPWGGAWAHWLPSVPAALGMETLLAEGRVRPALALALAWPLAAMLAMTLVARLPRLRAAGRKRGRSSLAWLDALHGAGRRGAADLGMARFVMTMLLRERSYRLRALPLLGLPASVALLGLGAAQDAGRLGYFLALVHVLPLVYTPALLVFLPFAEHWRASWLLELSLPDPAAASRRATVAVFGLLHLFVQLGLFALDASFSDPLSALTRSLAALGATWLLLPVLAAVLQGAVFSRDPESFESPDAMGSLLGFGLAVTIAGVALEAAAPTLQLGIAIALAISGLWIWRRGGYPR